MPSHEEEYLKKLLSVVEEEEKAVEELYQSVSECALAGGGVVERHVEDVDLVAGFAEEACRAHRCSSDVFSGFMGMPSLPYSDEVSTYPPRKPTDLPQSTTLIDEDGNPIHQPTPRPTVPLADHPDSIAAFAQYGTDCFKRGGYIVPSQGWRRCEVGFLYSAVYVVACRVQERGELKKEEGLEEGEYRERVGSQFWRRTDYTPDWDEIYAGIVHGFVVEDWADVASLLHSMLAEGKYLNPRHKVLFTNRERRFNSQPEVTRGPLECACMWHNLQSATLDRSYLSCLPDVLANKVATRTERNSIGFWLWGFLDATVRESPGLLTICEKYHERFVLCGGNTTAFNDFKNEVKSELKHDLFWPNHVYLKTMALYEMRHIEGEALVLGVAEKGLNLSHEELCYIETQINSHGAVGNADALQMHFFAKFAKFFTTKVWHEIIVTLTTVSGAFFKGFTEPLREGAAPRWKAVVLADKKLPRKLLNGYKEMRELHWATVCYANRNNPAFRVSQLHGNDTARAEGAIHYILNLTQRETLWQLTEIVNNDLSLNLTPYDVHAMMNTKCKLPLPRLKEPAEVFSLHLQRGDARWNEQTPDEVFVLRLQELRALIDSHDLSWRRAYTAREKIGAIKRKADPKEGDHSPRKRVKTAPKPATKPSTKTAAKPATKAVSKTASKPATKAAAVAKTAPKPATKPAAKKPSPKVHQASLQDLVPVVAAPPKRSATPVKVTSAREPSVEVVPDFSEDRLGDSLLSKTPAALLSLLGRLEMREVEGELPALELSTQIAAKVPACGETKAVLLKLLSLLSAGADPSQPGFVNAFNEAAREDYSDVVADPTSKHLLYTMEQHGSYHALLAGFSNTFGDTLKSLGERAHSLGLFDANKENPQKE